MAPAGANSVKPGEMHDRTRYASRIPFAASPCGGRSAGSRPNRQRLLIAYGDMPRGKRCRLCPQNPHPKIVEFSNQLGHFINVLKQSLKTKTTHEHHPHKTTRSSAHGT
jgi:hypothetical protein